MMVTKGCKVRAEEAQRIIDALAEKWRVSFVIEEILGHMAEVRSYERIADAHRLAVISDETAHHCIRLLDEAL